VKEINLAFLFPNLYEAIKLEKEANFLNKKEGKKMTKMTRPVIKHLAEINFKNWDRIDKAIRGLNDRLKDVNKDYVFHLNLRDNLERVRNDVIFIDESFRISLEKD